MHTAATATDKVRSPLETVLTARATRSQLEGVWAQMERADELSSPGPARAMTVQLSVGPTVSVVFHERTDLLEILAPLAANVEAGLADLLARLNIPPEAITWTHAGIDRSAIERLATT